MPANRVSLASQFGLNLPSLPRGRLVETLRNARERISLRRPGASPANYDDNGRLADLGRNLFELAVTDILFRQRPMLQAMEISVSYCYTCILTSALNFARL